MAICIIILSLFGNMIDLYSLKDSISNILVLFIVSSTLYVIFINVESIDTIQTSTFMKITYNVDDTIKSTNILDIESYNEYICTSKMIDLPELLKSKGCM